MQNARIAFGMEQGVPDRNSDSPGAARRHRAAGTLLVAAQLGLMAWLGVLALQAAAQGGLPLWGGFFGIVGALVGTWAISANRPGNFNIRPTPKAGGALVDTGPYRWIRHPMYTAVLAFGLGCALVADSAGAWIGWFALTAVLQVKAALEERWMRAAHPRYADYCRRTRRFVPFIY